MGAVERIIGFLCVFGLYLETEWLVVGLKPLPLTNSDRIEGKLIYNMKTQKLNLCALIL